MILWNDMIWYDIWFLVIQQVNSKHQSTIEQYKWFEMKEQYGDMRYAWNKAVSLLKVWYNDTVQLIWTNT